MIEFKPDGAPDRRLGMREQTAEPVTEREVVPVGQQPCRVGACGVAAARGGGGMPSAWLGHLAMASEEPGPDFDGRCWPGPTGLLGKASGTDRCAPRTIDAAMVTGMMAVGR